MVSIHQLTIVIIVMLRLLLDMAKLYGLAEKQWDYRLYAPLSSNQVSKLVQTGMTIGELTDTIGQPYEVQEMGGIMEYEYLLSTEKIKESDWIMSSFIVVISNRVVQSWRPNRSSKIYWGGSSIVP